MNFVRYIVLPVLISLLVHALVVFLMIHNWQSEPERREFKTPQFIEAKIVELKPKAKKATQEDKPKTVDLTERRRQAEEQKKREEARRAEVQRQREEAARKEAERKAQEEKARKERERLEELKRKAEEEERRQQQRLEEEFEQALKEEEGQLLEDSYATQAQSYAALIRRRVEQNWSRPPSARNGMRCELTLNLVPNGRVVDVRVTESSGNAAFDRSAVKAVQRIEVFDEIKDMPLPLFESEFRQFKMVFQPEDLRQ